MSKHEILELLKKPEKSTTEALSKFKSQVEEILGESKLLVPTSVLDGLIESYRSSLQSVLEVKTETSQQILDKLDRNYQTYLEIVDNQAKILDDNVEIKYGLGKKAENADLERQVLERIKAELG